MRKAKLQRIMAFLLAAIMLIGGGAIGASAASGDSSITNITTSDIKELLNAISYNDYVDDNKDVAAAKEELILSAVKDWTYVSKKGVVYNENGHCRVFDFAVRVQRKRLCVDRNDFHLRFYIACRAFRHFRLHGEGR